MHADHHRPISNYLTIQTPGNILQMNVPWKPPRAIRNTSAIFPDFSVTEVSVDGEGVVTWCAPDRPQPSDQSQPESRLQ